MNSSLPEIYIQMSRVDEIFCSNFSITIASGGEKWKWTVRKKRYCWLCAVNSTTVRTLGVFISLATIERARDCYSRRNVPNLLRNLLYIFLIFPSYYSLLLFVVLTSIISRWLNSQVLLNTERSSCWWFHALIQSIIFGTSEFRRRRIKSGAKWFCKDLLEKWSAMNFMIYSWQRGPTKKKKGDKGHSCVWVQRSRASYYSRLYELRLCACQWRVVIGRCSLPITLSIRPYT